MASEYNNIKTKLGTVLTTNTTLKKYYQVTSISEDILNKYVNDTFPISFILDGEENLDFDWEKVGNQIYHELNLLLYVIVIKNSDSDRASAVDDLKEDINDAIFDNRALGTSNLSLDCKVTSILPWGLKDPYMGIIFNLKITFAK